MKFMETKKIFSAGLAISTLLSGTVSAEGNMNSQVTTNADSRWNKEKVKSFLKKSAPYVAVGVPSAALLIGLAVYAYKKNSNEKNVQHLNNMELISDILYSGKAIGSSAIEKVHKEYQIYLQNELNNGCLPGFKFYRCKTENSVVIFSISYEHYSYVITDNIVAKSSLGISDDVTWKKVVLFQNRWLSDDNGDWSFKKIFRDKNSQFVDYFHRLMSSENGIEEINYNSGEHNLCGKHVFDRDDKEHLANQEVVYGFHTFRVITADYSNVDDLNGRVRSTFTDKQT